MVEEVGGGWGGEGGEAGEDVGRVLEGAAGDEVVAPAWGGLGCLYVVVEFAEREVDAV